MLGERHPLCLSWTSSHGSDTTLLESSYPPAVNSWERVWSRGDNGYINIARAHHACGVTTDPVYAIFEPRRHTADLDPADSLVVA